VTGRAGQLANSRNLLRVGLTAVLIALAFGRTCTLPPVLDDWQYVHDFHFCTGLPRTITAALPLSGGLFNRTFGVLFLYALDRTFAIGSVGAHATALVLHCLNALLIASIAGRLLRDQFKGTLTGLLYALAGSVHADPLSWAVGIYDLGGMFFFLLGLHFWSRARSRISALCYVASLLFKETYFFTPLLLLVWPSVAHQPDTATAKIKKLSAHLGIMGVVVASQLVRFPGLAREHPYVVSVGGHVWSNMELYCGWMVQAIVPSARLEGDGIGWIACILAVVLVIVATLRSSDMREPSPSPRVLLLLLAWVGAASGCLLFLPNHAYRYYLTPALPAVLMLAMVAMSNVLLLVRCTSIRPVLGFLTAMSLTGSLLFLTSYYDGESRLSRGTNGLVRRAAEVIAAADAVRAITAPLPPDAVLVFSGVNPISFGVERAPQRWLNDRSLRVWSAAATEEKGDLICFTARKFSPLLIHSQYRRPPQCRRPEQVVRLDVRTKARAHPRPQVGE